MSSHLVPAAARTSLFPQVAIVAHDAKKEELQRWLERQAEAFSGVRIVATGHTANVVRRVLGRAAGLGGLPEIESVASGPLGGDQQIGARIVEGTLSALIFLVDPLTAHPHEADIQALLRVGRLAEIPLATNLATADLIAANLALQSAGRDARTTDHAPRGHLELAAV
ncbi:MAG: methylglyoxal synthase [Deltaproteobacteria bacterium]|nr:methylglyoxal synthase [Deltaproteobacteria bacterium]